MGQAAATDLPATWARSTLGKGQGGNWENKLSPAIVALPPTLTFPGGWDVGGPHNVPPHF